MKGLTFIITDKNQDCNVLGFARIEILDKYVLYKEIFDIHTEEECHVREMYEYSLDTICDGEFMHTSEDELLEAISHGCYQLERKGVHLEEQR